MNRPAEMSKTDDNGIFKKGIGIFNWLIVQGVPVIGLAFRAWNSLRTGSPDGLALSHEEACLQARLGKG